MLLNRENKENRQVVLTIQVEQSAWEKALEDAYEQSKSLFKKEDGSLPTRQEMEEKHGADVFYQDAVNSTFPVALVEAVRQEDISVAGAPELSVEAIGPEGYVFTALIDLYPEVKLGQYKGLSAPRPQVELSDDDVTAAIDEYLQGHLTEEHPKKAAMGDEVVLDFEGFDNGVAFDGGKGENFDLEIGSGSFVPGFEDQLMGMKVGEEKDIDITFPEDYTPELAGKPVVFHVKVNEVKVKEVPAIDDEFAKDVSEFDTLKELKADLKKKITDERKTAAQHAFEDALMQKVADGIEADIPEDMVVLQSQRMMENFKQQLAAQGIPFDQYVKMTGMDEDAIQKQSMEPALKQVRMDLAVSAIVKAENLEASDEEVENEMKTIAEKYGMDLESIKKYLPASDVKEQVIREKVIKVVADSAVAVEPEEKAEEKSEDKAEEKKEDKE